MYHFPMKKLVGTMHMPHGHEAFMRMEHLMRDARFWAIVAVITLMALVITLAVLTDPSETAVPEMPFKYPLPVYQLYP